MEQESEVQKNNVTLVKLMWLGFFGILSMFVIGYIFLFLLAKAPDDFSINTAIVIEEGLPAVSVTNVLEEQSAVRSSTFLYVVLVLLYEPSEIKAGTYRFSEPLTVFEVAEYITNVTPQEKLVSLTFPEGFTVTEYAKIASQTLPNFDAIYFIQQAKKREGYFFPDTYFIPEDYSEDELLQLLEKTYKEKTKTLDLGGSSDSLTEYEVLILASIIEREANTYESMRGVARVFLNRLDIGMALQADASIEYVLQKPINELVASDLKIDSPYNTYLNKGLPPTPIGNPGLLSIQAVLDPVSSQNFYYITDREGVFHFTETFAAHKQNIARYLR